MHRPLQIETLQRIEFALRAARDVFARFTPGKVAAEYKEGHDPVTEADTAVDAVLKKELLRPGEGWLSEESADDMSRLERERVWVVDPLDGTREFVAGIPEFCVSVAMVEDGKPVAGGICNPATNEVFLGSLDTGLTYNGTRVQVNSRSSLQGAVVLASRSEVKRGEWKRFENAPFQVRPMGSVAYKLALVSAGFADATFTLTPKHEWDVAGGVALVQSSAGCVQRLDGAPLKCNRKDVLMAGLIACAPGLHQQLTSYLTPFQPRVLIE
jgi:myo-inositol-1(or 4)-monophosphatase